MYAHQRTRRAPRVLATLFSAGLVFTACTTDDDTATDDRPPPPLAGEEVTVGPDSATEDAEPSDDETMEVSTEPVGEFSTEVQESEEELDWDTLHDIYPTTVRSAVQDGFERIVIEHAGSGRPGYHVEYTDTPAEPGIGTPVDTGSEAYLEVTLSGTADQHDMPPDMLEHGVIIDDLDTEATDSLVSFAPWEATSTYYLGLDEQRPYAVTMLGSPIRVIIDIQLDDE